MRGLPSMCSWLIENGCDINRSSAFGTPLHCALLGFSAYRYSVSGLGDGSYLYLNDFASEDVVDLMLEAGAEINCYYESGPERLSTLFITLLYGNADIVMRLLDDGGILDDRCLDLLESHLEDGDICDIVNHAKEHNVEPDRCVSLLKLTLKAGQIVRERPHYIILCTEETSAVFSISWIKVRIPARQHDGLAPGCSGRECPSFEGSSR